jgi:quercetin dioxygenase-like cupin family protein
MTIRFRSIMIKFISLILFIPFAASSTDRKPLSDHGDGHIGDYYVYKRGERLVMIMSITAILPTDISMYRFPDDIVYKFFIDRNPGVSFENAEAVKRYGGTVVKPENILEDVVFSVRFNKASSSSQLSVKGLKPSESNEISVYAGVFDDPFIRGGLEGKDIAAIIVELPLKLIISGKDEPTIISWATTNSNTPKETMHDLCGHPYRSQRLKELNILHPRDHLALMNVPPDVFIYNTAKPTYFPNGRELADDIVDILGPEIIKDNPPFPSENDVKFSADFPYLAKAHGAASPQPRIGVIPGPPTYNIFNAPLTVFDLSKELNIKDERRVRVRYWIMPPAGIIGDHIHESRPAIVYLLQGEVMETKLDTDRQIKVKQIGAHEVVFENSGIEHWWVNQTNEMVKMVAIDVIRPVDGDIFETARIPRSETNPFKPPTKYDNVKVENLGEHNLAIQFPGIPELTSYVMRARKFTLMPGEKTALQNSQGQPTVTYVISGDALEQRSDQDMSIRRTGDFTYVTGNVSYYWENPSIEKAILFVVDFVKKN